MPQMLLLCLQSLKEQTQTLHYNPKPFSSKLNYCIEPQKRFYQSGGILLKENISNCCFFEFQKWSKHEKILQMLLDGLETLEDKPRHLHYNPRRLFFKHFLYFKLRRLNTHSTTL